MLLMASAPPAVTDKDPVVPPNNIGLLRVMFPAAFKITVDPGLKWTDDAPLVVMAPEVADRLKGPLPLLVTPSAMTILPCVAVAEKLPVEPRLSDPSITIAFELAIFLAVIVILPNPDVAIGEATVVENDPVVF